MSTLVCFHAHPDDESIATGGTMFLASQAGHTVVLVTATRGEQGEPQPGVLAEGEPLWERRVIETKLAADILGVHRAEFLGYEDSGMIGEPTNDNPACFWQADVEEAAQRLAAILVDVDADVLTIYDSHGGYGHPDHIQVHRVGSRAAEIAGVDRVFQSTMNRDRIMKQMAENANLFEDEVESELEGETVEQMRRRASAADRGEFGSPEALITHAIDVASTIDTKRAAMAAHASQIGPDSFFFKMPTEMFSAAFGTEWFIALGGTRASDEPFVNSIIV
ncbi:MAG: GlcNAc-PI de-N-acetylase [Actinobacteria bacterium]|jgi:LmbE family N-acetylglucosaminyl deacetylase|nr:GlcNAc-PI de-N-acetylase [Actinomycetota bacterium]